MPTNKRYGKSASGDRPFVSRGWGAWRRVFAYRCSQEVPRRATTRTVSLTLRVTLGLATGSTSTSACDRRHSM